jgi:hypothetical protein
VAGRAYDACRIGHQKKYVEKNELILAARASALTNSRRLIVWLSSGRAAPGADTHASRQRFLQHHHLGDGLAGYEAHQLAGGIGDANRRRRFLLQ